jgi:hypothetical protein
MVNARTVASALELDFRFVWLREGNSELEDPAELFDGAFLDHHEISSGSLDGMTPVIGEEVADLEYRLGAPGDDDEAEGRFADLVDPFTIWGLGRGADEEAQARFVDSFRSLGWNEVVSSLMSVCAKQDTGDGWTAVHLRAGDIVTGEWRHIMHHEKYTPLAYVEHAIEQLGLGDANALILSDSEACVDHLRARYERLVVPSELLPGYDRLTESQRALAEILLMSRCDRIAGPHRSAFSCLAANLGGTPIIRPDLLLPDGQEADILEAAIRRSAGQVAPFERLAARDIGWYVDVFGDAVTVDRRLAMIERALRLDDDFAGMHARLARTSAAAGSFRQARRAAERARQIAVSVDRHDDPLLEALASTVAVRCLESFRPWHGPPSAGAVSEVSADLDRCIELRPHQIYCDEVVASLRFLVGLMGWFSAAPRSFHRLAVRRLASRGFDAVDVSSFRCSGLEAHRKLPLYDPVSRDLERIVISLSSEIGAAFAARHPSSQLLVETGVDRIATTHTEGRWLEGDVQCDTGGPTLVLVRLPENQGWHVSPGVRSQAGSGAFRYRIPVPDAGHLPDDLLRRLDAWIVPAESAPAALSLAARRRRESSPES